MKQVTLLLVAFCITLQARAQADTTARPGEIVLIRVANDMVSKPASEMIQGRRFSTSTISFTTPSILVAKENAKYIIKPYKTIRVGHLGWKNKEYLEEQGGLVPIFVQKSEYDSVQNAKKDN